MDEQEEFLAWFRGPLYAAERAIHDGDPGPRHAIWSDHEPVTVLGAWRNAVGRTEVAALFDLLATSFSDCTRYDVELLAYDVQGDMAYTVAFEHTDVTVDGQLRSYTLRGTQVYRREDGAWQVAHRHGDTFAIRPVAGGTQS